MSHWISRSTHVLFVLQMCALDLEFEVVSTPITFFMLKCVF